MKLRNRRRAAAVAAVVAVVTAVVALGSDQGHLDLCALVAPAPVAPDDGAAVGTRVDRAVAEAEWEASSVRAACERRADR